MAGRPAGASKSREPVPTGPPPRVRARAVAFPLRLGAVDVGSNALRFLGAEFESPDSYRVLHQERVPIRLGHEVFLTGRLSGEAAEGAVRTLVGFAATAKRLGLTRLRAATTSAVRESANGEEFTARVREKAGFDLEVISGSEEARLIHRAVRRRIPFGDRTWLLADLGGGSVEVSLADRNGVLWTESHTMGAVRLLEELTGAGEEPGRFLDLLKEYAATLRVPRAAEGPPLAGFAATGGNMETVADLVGARPGARGVSVVTLDALRRLIERLASLSFRQRVTLLGLKEDRADVILPAAIVYERLAVLGGLTRIHVPRVGLREGLLLDLADDLTAPRRHEDDQDRQAYAGALALGRRYFFDEPHGVHVAHLAASLFDQMAGPLGLPSEERRLLTAAALLHDIGSYISFKRHHRHTWYLLSESELPGFSPAEMRVVALVARYHRKGMPKIRHDGYADLPKEERVRVDRLAALLRLADALDREHRQSVHHVWLKVTGSAATLALEGEGDLLLERWALKRKADLFEKCFGVRLDARNGGGQP